MPCRSAVSRTVSSAARSGRPAGSVPKVARVRGVPSALAPVSVGCGGRGAELTTVRGMSCIESGTGHSMPQSERLLLGPAQAGLVGCVMAALFVLTGVSGDDVFARHVGMMASAPAVMPEAPRDTDRAVPAETIRQVTGDGLSARPGHPAGGGDGSAHLMHLLGACLAVLAFSLLLLCRGRWALVTTRARRALRPRSPSASQWIASVRESPPPITPPRTSPVIRT